MITFSLSPASVSSMSLASLYFLAEQDSPAPPYRVAFYTQQSKGAVIPEEIPSEEISLKQSWDLKQGIYLFLKDFASNEASAIALLTQRISEFLLTPAVRHTRFLWIENPAAPVFQWNASWLSIVPESRAVAQLSFFDLRNYGLAIARHTTCTLSADGSGFLFSRDPRFHHLPGETTSGKTAPFYFSTSNGAAQLIGIEANEQGEALSLACAGALAGCFSFALTLKNEPSAASFEDLKQMDIGLRTFFKSANASLDPQDPFSGFSELNSTDKFLVSTHRYPFLGEERESAMHYSQQANGRQDITLYATLDPLSALNAARSYFAFTPPDHEAISTHSFPSCYRTNVGYTLHVTPHGYSSSRLVFAERLGQVAGTFSAPLYLTPHGKFTLSVPDYSQTPVPDGNTFPIRDEDDFLCGLAGIEYIQLSHVHENVLTFTAGEPAFSPDFTPNAVVETEAAEQRLEAIATTAWATIEHTDASNFPIYFSQPKQSLLYRASEFLDSDQDSTNDPLRFLEVPVTGLPPTTALPLFPYGGVEGALSHYRQMEEQLLNPHRRKHVRAIAQTDTTPLSATASAISSLPLAFDSPPAAPLASTEPTAARAIAADTSETEEASGLEDNSTGNNSTEDNSTEDNSTSERILGTTPQGLLASYTTDFEYISTLLLAKDTEDKPLSFHQLARSSALRLAFQSSQMFLVVANASALLNVFPDNQLTIQGWTFDLSPSRWRQGRGNTDTVLIFKFIDKPLIETLRDLALWEQTETFVNADGAQVKKVRDRLIAQFEQAITISQDSSADAAERQSAAPLARVATSLSWSGMVALNVRLSPQGLPDELKSLKCGIKDSDSLYAQYIGSNGTPVLPQQDTLGTTLTAQQSSLFGLLNYKDDAIPAANPSGYDFQVGSLRIQFQNSQITAFSSELNLTLDKLFDESTQLLNSQTGRNIVVLQGTTEQHDGAITYAFTFSGANYFALPDSHVLNHVDIVKTTFTSDPSSVSSSTLETETAVGRFTLWGRLNFRNIEAFDGFSFGSEAALAEAVIAGSAALNSNARALKDDFQSAKEALAEAQSQLQVAIAQMEENTQYLQFSKLSLIMRCQHIPNQETVTTFSMSADKMTFDLARTQARPGSLYSKFPLKLVNFVAFSDQTPQQVPKGYLPVKTPLSDRGKNALPKTGFGLNFELNLGSLGALAGAAQLIVNLLFVWEPNADAQQKRAVTFVGLKMPGVGGDVLGFPLQSMLKLSFKQVEMMRDRTQAKPAYLLKIKNVGLKLFVLKFPPNGQTEIVIFGNPEAADDNNALGWYAAYAKEPAALPAGEKKGGVKGRASPRR